MTTEYHPPGATDHPVRRYARAITAVLEEGRAIPLDHLDAEVKAEALLEVSRAQAHLEAFKLGLLAVSADVAERDGARDVGAWMAHHARTDPGQQRRDLRLAEALDRRWSRVGTALATAELNRAQAEVIVAALDDLDTSTLEPDVVERAEIHLIELAAHFSPRQLRILGRRILDVVAPEVGERHEALALEREEQRARERTTLSMRPVGDGCTRIAAVVPDAVAHRLRTYLEAFTSPRHDVGGGEADRIPSYRQRGQAFCALLESVDPGRLPMHGGDATTVFVTVTLDQLRTELATAGLVTADDDRISASEARRLACTASIVPVVLGGKSEVLDLGRSARLFSPAQRKALRIRDRRCRARGCTIRAEWCEGHHRDPWAVGGATDLDRGVLLCSFHHHRAHDPGYRTEDLPDGDIAFTRTSSHQTTGHRRS
jgi:hypothetical protein